MEPCGRALPSAMAAPSVEKPVTETKIPGTDVPDVGRAAVPPPAETDAQRRWMARVAVSTSVMAALAAISSSVATGHLNQAMLQQILEADRWSFYQAKSVKESVLEGRIETAAAMKVTLRDEDAAKLRRYGEEKEQIRAEAEGFRAAAARHMTQYTRSSRAATAAQIGIALAAVALLLRRNVYWFLSLAAGAVAAAFFTWAFAA